VQIDIEGLKREIRDIKEENGKLVTMCASLKDSVDELKRSVAVLYNITGTAYDVDNVDHNIGRVGSRRTAIKRTPTDTSKHTSTDVSHEDDDDGIDIKAIALSSRDDNDMY
jgi:hypothetical protein